MGNIFAGSEVVEIGIQIEKNGKDFYQILATQSKDPKAQGALPFWLKKKRSTLQFFGVS